MLQTERACCSSLTCSFYDLIQRSINSLLGLFSSCPFLEWYYQFIFYNNLCQDHFPSPKFPICLNISSETMTILLSNTDEIEMFTLDSVNLGLQYKAKKPSGEKKTRSYSLGSHINMRRLVLYCLSETHKQAFSLQKVVHHTVPPVC